MTLLCTYILSLAQVISIGASFLCKAVLESFLHYKISDEQQLTYVPVTSLSKFHLSVPQPGRHTTKEEEKKLKQK